MMIEKKVSICVVVLYFDKKVIKKREKKIKKNIYIWSAIETLDIRKSEVVHSERREISDKGWLSSSFGDITYMCLLNNTYTPIPT